MMSTARRAEQGYTQPVANTFFSELSVPYIIAEMSANHLGSFSNAEKIIRAAAKAGASAVKLQHYSPATITAQSRRPEFVISGKSAWAGMSLWELYDLGQTPWEWTGELAKICNEEGIDWFSSPFDESAVDFLEDFDPPMFKVASLEIVDLPLIQKIARTGKPMILSTGMSTEQEISEAIEAAKEAGNANLALLRTNSSYPAPVNEMDLRAIVYMAEKWGFPVGLSDHTLDHTAAIVATALGARIFEKHLTLRRSEGGPDAGFSLEPEEFADYVAKINDATSSLGTERLGPSPEELESIKFRPSIRAVKAIKKGDILTFENVATIRPAGGLHPRFMPLIVGRTAASSLGVGDPILEDYLSA